MQLDRRTGRIWIGPGLLLLLAVPLALALAGGPGGGSGGNEGGGGIQSRSPSMTRDMPPEVLSWRNEIHPTEHYVEMAQQWRSYLDQHPGSAVAHVQLARALRYAGSTPVGERHDLYRRALELDPDCPEALNAIADTQLHSEAPVTSTPEEARLRALRAVELAPTWAEPHFTLWSLALKLGRADEADDHLRAMIEKGGIPSPVLDLGYNLMMSTAPGAILLTNGDNDTYAPLALQATYQTRTDVAIVNLSLLNLPEYARTVWRGTFGEAGPFNEAEIDALYARCKAQECNPDCVRLAHMVVRELLRRVRQGEWTQPVYFAITVSPANLALCELEREIEGVTWRVLPAPRETDDDAGWKINLARTVHLFQEEFRLDSATDYGFRWSPGNAVTPLMRNYSAVLQMIASASAEQNAVEWMRYALREALRQLEFHGEEALVRQTAEYWRKIEPDNSEIDRWLSPE